ncbi:MAG: hypothetical protein QOH27_1285 [Mycobacterium sp.]|nr:hypothetical protein [Mycobacterium sp.]
MAAKGSRDRMSRLRIPTAHNLGFAGHAETYD